METFKTLQLKLFKSSTRCYSRKYYNTIFFIFINVIETWSPLIVTIFFSKCIEHILFGLIAIVETGILIFKKNRKKCLKNLKKKNENTLVFLIIFF